jgi:hypothetical protein
VDKDCDCRAGAPPAILVNPMAHPPPIPIWLRWDQSVICFVTICVADRKPVLANRQAFNAFKVAASKLEHWHILAAILMPDHLHVLVAPTKEREAKLGNFSAALKRWMREELKASWKWQPGCFDRLLRSGDSLHEKWLLCPGESSSCRTCTKVGGLAVSI